ncbi:DUF1127 domain-containing protein [Agrobacterium vitis]|uniref:DUF1127 domain-containing protein n=1 Tax=Agrobacterium vitis TaxID=373 RepID=A0A6L6VJ81_AGRVI|nr:DUF1127 domain-containing protein [Agrobacterium vitis]MUZ75903.1 DUF1127 domain-containing protein [Agrobacterium vitis]
MKFWQKIRKAAENRKAIRELYMLDAHVLADVGVLRSQISSAVRGL